MDKFCIIVNKDRDEHLELTGRVQDFLAAQGKTFAVRMESLDGADGLPIRSNPVVVHLSTLAFILSTLLCT